MGDPLTADVLLLDSNAIGKLGGQAARQKLRANLRATGREFWPTAINVLEAVKARNPQVRARLLSTLADLANDKHVVTLPTEVLRLVVSAIAEERDAVDLSEAALTTLLIEPDSVTDDHVAEVREHFASREAGFRSTHERAGASLCPVLQQHGGIKRWPTVAAFLDEAWTTELHMEAYLCRLWEEWSLTLPVRTAEVLAHPVWRLFFDGWGATLYAKTIAHPQPRWVESADYEQLVYLGLVRSGLLVSDDVGLRALGNSILKRRYPMTEVVGLQSMIEV